MRSFRIKHLRASRLHNWMKCKEPKYGNVWVKGLKTCYSWLVIMHSWNLPFWSSSEVPHKNKNTHIQDCHQTHFSFHLLFISPVFWLFKTLVSSPLYLRASSVNKLEWASLPLSLSPGFPSSRSRFIPILHWGANTHRERADDQQSSGKRQQVTSSPQELAHMRRSFTALTALSQRPDCTPELSFLIKQVSHCYQTVIPACALGQALN